MIGAGAGYSRRHLRPFWAAGTHNRLAALTAPAASPRWRRCAERRLWSAASHCRSSPRLLLEVDVGQRLPVLVADDETGAGLIDLPWRREAARRAILIAVHAPAGATANSKLTFHPDHSARDVPTFSRTKK